MINKSHKISLHWVGRYDEISHGLDLSQSVLFVKGNYSIFRSQVTDEDHNEAIIDLLMK